MPLLRTPVRSTTALGLIALALGPGCNGPDPDPAPPASGRARDEEPRPRPTAYTFDGVVRAVEPDEGVVAIDHEDIPGLMPAMLMDFRIEDRTLLDDVVVGDEVRGTLRVGYTGGGGVKEMELVDLVVSRPATAPPMTLDLSGGVATLRERLPELEPGQPVPDFAMTTQDGKTLRLSDLRGQVVVLTFVFTRCPQPDFCPLMDLRFAGLSQRVARSSDRADRVRLLSVSFDPEHDTPEVLAEHARRVGATPPLWTYAVASHEELRKVAEPLGLSYAPMSDQIRHTLSTAVIAPDGTLARLEGGNEWRAEDLYGEARRLLGAAGR